MVPIVRGLPDRDWVFKFHHRWWRPRLHHLVLESDKSGVRTGSGKEEFGGGGRKASTSDDRKMAGAAGGGAVDAAGGGGGGAVDDLEVWPLGTATSHCYTSNHESINVVERLSVCRSDWQCIPHPGSGVNIKRWLCVRSER